MQIRRLQNMIFALLLFVLMILGCTDGMSAHQAQAASESANADVAEIQVLDLNGKGHRLKEFSKKPLLLVFWATWCDSCLKEFSVLNRLTEQFKGKLQVVAVSVDTDEKVLKDFLKKQKTKFQVFRSPKPLDDLQKVGGGEGVPYTALYDRDLYYVAGFAGSRDEGQLKALISPLTR